MRSLKASSTLDDLEAPPEIDWNHYLVIVRGNIAFGSTTNNGFAFARPKRERKMPTIVDYHYEVTHA